MGKGRKGPRPHTRGERPESWLSGPDRTRHVQHTAWRQQKNQAQWRGETWDLSFEDWVELWGDLWPHRGRLVTDYCMTRRDWELPWTRTNAHVITRSEHAQMHGRRMADGWVSPARSRWRELKGIERKTSGRKRKLPCNE